MELPTDVAVWEITTCLAQAAQVCQKQGLAVAIELNIQGDLGSHSIERTAYVCEKVCSHAVRLLNEHDVILEAVTLVSSICQPGNDAAPARPEDVAAYTARALRRTVPPALGSVHLLPGSLAPKQAARHVHDVQEAAHREPWCVSPVYGSTLLSAPLNEWASTGEMDSAREVLLRVLGVVADTQFTGSTAAPSSESSESIAAP